MTGRGVFIGREALLARLLGVVDPAGRAAAVVVRGEAEIGKSTVLDAVVDGALDAGVRVRREAAVALQQDVPFAMAADLFGLRPQTPDDTRAALGRLVVGEEAASAIDPYAKVLAVTEGLADVLMGEATSTATVLVVDDLHWLRALGVRARGRIVDRSPTGRDSLTDAERRVVDEVAKLVETCTVSVCPHHRSRASG